MKHLLDDVKYKDDIRDSLGTRDLHSLESLSVILSHAGSQKGVDTAKNIKAPFRDHKIPRKHLEILICLEIQGALGEERRRRSSF